MRYTQRRCADKRMYAPTGPVMTTQKKLLLDQLYEPYRHCTACPLGNLGRTQVVFGEGSLDAKIMFIGEGPGQQEDEQGRPFVGRSGKLLNRVLETAGLKRADVYIANIVKCRPPNNRKPFPNESKTCKQLLLLKQIGIIKPQVICTLGAAALEGLLEQPIKITQVRGRPIELGKITIIPTYHPAYILRNAKELPQLLGDILLAIQKTK